MRLMDIARSSCLTDGSWEIRRGQWKLGTPWRHKGFLDISELIQGRKGALMPMYRCFHSQLRAFALFSIAAIIPFSVAAQNSNAAQPSAATQPNDPRAQNAVPSAPAPIAATSQSPAGGLEGVG